MIIYNVTTKVDASIQNEWLAWLQTKHIPAVLNTGCFTKAIILQLLEIDDTGGPTYAIQYHAESKSLYNEYIEKFSGILQRQYLDKWGDQFVSFPTLMKVVN